MTPDQKQSIFQDAKRQSLRAAQLLTPAWTDEDFVAFEAMAKKNRMDPFDLLTVITSESHDLEPSARNPRNRYEWPIAVGLNQLTRAAAAGAGLIPGEKVPGDQSNFPDWKKFADEVVKMTVGKQIPIIDAYYQASPWTRAGNEWKTATKIYAYNAAAGTAMRDIDDRSIIATPGSAEYPGLAGLGTDSRGNVTGRTIRGAIEFHWDTPLYQAAFLRLGAPSMRMGWQQGWQDGSARMPRSAASFEAPNLDMYAIGYNEGYAAAQMGLDKKLPAYLA
jgi:hypothetical protein